MSMFLHSLGHDGSASFRPEAQTCPQTRCFGGLPSCSQQFSGGVCGPFSEISILPTCSPSCKLAVDHKVTENLHRLDRCYGKTGQDPRSFETDNHGDHVINRSEDHVR
jgi:hypothetical protein